jgi:death-on-curing family protein
MKIIIPSVDSIIRTNKFCSDMNGQHSVVLDKGKIESALHTAFYPGSEPFLNGGIAKLAGALCFYLTKSHAFQDGNKRTATYAAVIFMQSNGWDLQFADNDEEEFSDLAKIVIKATASEITKEELMEWFESHKIRIDD